MATPHRTLAWLLVAALSGCLSAPQPSPADVLEVLPPALAAQFGAPINMTKERASREVSLAISPQDSKIQFACAPSGLGNPFFRQSYFYRSLDSGLTWEYVTVKTEAADARRAVFEGGDCDVAIDQSGAFYAADSWGGSISVGASRDRGQAWTSGTPLAGSAPVADRPWLVAGPAGTVHLTYQDVQFSMPSAIWYTRSTDYGATFAPVALVARATPEGPFTWTGNLVVSASGQDLYSIYTRRPQPSIVGSLDQAPPEEVWVAISHDAGRTWESQLISKRGGPASYLYPSLALDRGGILHAVWAERAPKDHPVFYSYSRDAGTKWSEPVALLAGVGAYSPWVDAREPGQAVVQWYGSPKPQPSLNAKEQWFVYYAKVRLEGDAPQIEAGPTTERPVFEGIQGAISEFNQVRLDNEGNMRIASAVRFQHQESNSVRWMLTYQGELPSA